MDHSPGFLKLWPTPRSASAKSPLTRRAPGSPNPKIVLLDVREDPEWKAGHAAEAVHLGKGVLERDLEK